MALGPDVAIVARDPCRTCRPSAGVSQCGKMWCKQERGAVASNISGKGNQRQYRTTHQQPGHTANMPGRTSTRSTRTSTASTTKRASSARQSANAVEIPDDGPVTSLRTEVAQVFGDAQKTTTTQRKLVVNLRKIQEACVYEPPTTNNKAGKKGQDAVQEEYDEEDFNGEIERCVLRILGIKKSEPVGDRLIRFLGLFLKYALDKGKQPRSELRIMEES
jgi:hypothetical protein